MKQLPTSISISEAQYESKLLLKRVETPQEDSKEEELSEKEEILWAKATETEKTLHSELAWYKRLPKEVTRKKTVRNLTKVLLRTIKILNARAAAFEILSGLLKFKKVTRSEEVADMNKIVKEATILRTALIGFRSEMRFFGSDFIYDGLELFSAFENIHDLLPGKTSELKPGKILHKIQGELFSTADILRESCQTVQVGLVTLDSLREEEKGASSLFEDFEYYESPQRPRAESTLIGGVPAATTRRLPRTESMIDTVHLSIEHGIAFDLRCSFDQAAAMTLMKQRRFEGNSKLSQKNPMLLYEQESCSTELDMIVNSPIESRRSIPGLAIIEQGNDSDKRATIRVLDERHFIDLDCQVEDEDLAMMTLEPSDLQPIKVSMAMADAENDF